MNRYTSFFGAYNASVKRGNPYSKEDVVKDFTAGRTKSLKDLSHAELQELTRSLNQTSGFVAGSKYANDKADKMRKSIIAIFYKMDRTANDAKAWAEKQGARGQKKRFNDYTTGELYVLIGVAEKIYEDWAKAIRNRMETVGKKNN